MKKALFVVLVISMFVCILSISAGAVTGSESNEFGEITYVEGLRADTQLTDKSSRVVLLNSDGTYSTYPTYYICDVKLQWQGTTQYDFSAINSALKTSYDMMKIVRIEIITDATIWNPNGGVLHGNTNLVEVRFPEGTQITEIGGQTFKGCTNLKSITIPKSVKTLGWLCFEHCYGLEEVIFEEGSQLTKLGGPTFQRCDSLKEIKFPDSLTSASGLILQACGSLERVYFGRNFTSALSSNAFQSTPTKGLQIFLPDFADFASVIKAAPGATLVTSLTKAQAEELEIGKAYSYDELMAAGKFEESAIVYGCPQCMMFADGGTHRLENINTCIGRCSVCGFVAKFESPVHQLKVFYENGFACGGIVYESCQNELCGYSKDIKELSAIICFVGYSVSEDLSALCAGYCINQGALEEYEKYNGEEKISYGIYFGVFDGESDNFLSYDAGEIKSINGSGVAVNLNRITVGFDFKISGFNESTQNTEIILCAYVGNGARIDYLTGYDLEIEPITVSRLAK